MRNTPDDNLAYPVLILLDNGSTGSGFFLNMEDNIFLITAKHVLFDDLQKAKGCKTNLICQTKDINDESTTLLEIDLETLNAGIDIFKHPNKDIAGLKIGIYNSQAEQPSIDLCNGIKIIQEGNSPVVAMQEKTIKKLDEVLVSNDVFLYGYPISLGLKGSPQFDYKKPLLRKGIVANTYKSLGTIILDCPVYYGNSGGPVIQVSTDGVRRYHHIIGVVIEFIPYEEKWKNELNGLINKEWHNSGYSVAIAMDYVLEMINNGSNY